MADFQLGDLVWIISFDEQDEFFLLSKQTITEFLDENTVECEDDFNTFHVAYDDIYRNKNEAVNEMMRRLSLLLDK